MASLKVKSRIAILSLALACSPICANDVNATDDDSKISIETERCLEVCRAIIQLARTERSQQKVDNKIDTILMPVSGIENNLYLVRILVLSSQRFSNGDPGFAIRSACDYAIYRCAWWIACSDQKGSAEALANVKKEWQPDAMNGLLFHRCELRQQHKPDSWL